MADKPEGTGQEPNLELPTLLPFGRRKRRQDEVGQAEVSEAEAPTQQIPVPPPPLPPPDEPGEVGKPPEVDPWKHEVGGAGATEAERAQITELAAGGPDTSARHQHQPVPPTPPEQTTVLDVGARDADLDAAPDPGPDPGPDPAPDPGPDVRVDEPFRWPVEEPLGDAEAERPSRGASLELPVLNPRIAAILSGAVVGLVGVVLSYSASRGCETVRGVGSCGGMGLLALLLILAIEVVLGAVLLKALQLSDPTSTSFLGVGLMAVFVLLFLLSSLESTWMMLVIPVVSALTFLLSWWVIATFVQGPDSAQHR